MSTKMFFAYVVAATITLVPVFANENKANVGATESSVGATKSSVNASKANVQATKSSVSATKSTVSVTKSNVSATKLDSNVTKSKSDAAKTNVIASKMNVDSQSGGGSESKVSIVYDHVLPNVPGKSIKGVLVEYAPGGSTPAHTHAKSAFIYATVLEGAIRSQVNDGPVKIYKKGENFSENPGDHHGVSENASKTEPAKLLAVFVVDTDDKVLTTVSSDK